MTHSVESAQTIRLVVLAACAMIFLQDQTSVNSGSAWSDAQRFFSSALVIAAFRCFAKDATQSWNEARYFSGVLCVGFAEFRHRIAFLCPGKLDVHDGQHGKHGKRQDRWPLQQKSKHHHDESDILGMAHVTVGTRTS